MPSGAVALSPWAGRLHKPVFIAFVWIWVANWVLGLLRVVASGAGRGLVGLLPVAGCATTMLVLARRLPLENVLMAGLLIGGLGSIITAVGALSGVPFGPIYYADRLGEKLAGVVPWPIP